MIIEQFGIANRQSIVVLSIQNVFFFYLFIWINLNMYDNENEKLKLSVALKLYHRAHPFTRI